MMSFLLEGVGAARHSKAPSSQSSQTGRSHLRALSPHQRTCCFATLSPGFLGDRRLQNVRGSQPHHLLTVGPWTGDLTSLSPSFPTCQVEICYLGALGSAIETK